MLNATCSPYELVVSSWQLESVAQGSGRYTRLAGPQVQLPLVRPV